MAGKEHFGARPTDWNSLWRDRRERCGRGGGAGAPCAAAAELGVASDLAAMLREDPPGAENALRSQTGGMARSTLSDAGELIDHRGKPLDLGSKTFRRVEAEAGYAMTLIGSNS